MNFVLKRIGFTAVSTVGSLYVGSEKICDTLEDKDRMLETSGQAAKVRGRTAIPRGRYELTINWSNRFKKYMIAVLDVPYFEGVRMHSGNTHFDTDGCILLGDYADENTLINSKAATERVFCKVEDAIKSGKVYLEVV